MITGVVFRRFLHAFTMIYIIIGMFYFYMLSDFSYTIYAKNVNYYVFAKSYEVLLMACIIFPLKEAFWQWVCLGSFFVVIRLPWEVFAIKDYAKANRPSIIFSLFCIDVLCMIIILIIQVTKNRKW